MTDRIVESLKKTDYVIIPITRLENFLAEVDIVEEVNTYISDFLRIVSFRGHLLVQELSPKEEVIIRKVHSLEAAHTFIAQRMDIYEKMWDGCGCKVNYYA